MQTSMSTLTYEGKGLTSRQPIQVKLLQTAPGSGIIFRIPDRKNEGATVDIPALASSVVNTLRNVTIGEGSNRLCLVEHILCAIALFGLEDVLVEVNGPEIPLGDGSSAFWSDMLASSNWERRVPESVLELPEPIFVKKGDRLLAAIPDEKFSVDYMMDWNHPLIGKRWQSFEAKNDPREVTDARTFGSEKEHMLLGIADEVVSLNDDGFSKPLRFADEPVRHKLLDLIGDLTLAGVNPLKWKARFISIKGGHEMDVEMAKRLATLLAAKN